MISLNDYAQRLVQETLAATEAAGDALRVEVFTSLVAERLAAAGEFSDAEVTYHRARGVEVSGWSFDEDEAVLHLLVTDHRGEAPPGSLTGVQIGQAFRRLRAFFTRSVEGYADRLEESSPAFELADLIARQAKRLEGLRLYLFSDGHARNLSPVADEVVEGLRVTHHVWDLERLYRLDTSGHEHEPIFVDLLARWGAALPCLPGPRYADHAVYLVIVPGRLLADLYHEFGARLLERNVRSFLQARGAVNKGIRETLLTDAEHFLAYNNGIAATASEVRTVAMDDGGLGITALRDLQIVNGGQTTASIHNVAYKERVDVSGVSVQAKLTVVDASRVDEMVPHISKYSNTQNKVTGADFSANDPFHVRVDELSRTVWAPAPDGTQRQTHWFYERARGQYADDARAGTPAKQRLFKLTNPPQQRFTKTDLSKFEHSWEQLPHLVSLGAEKNFREFMLRLAERPGFAPDLDYFQRLVAKAILFRSTEKIVSAEKFGGYRANIVTYTIAKLAHSTAHRLDLHRIWRTQQISPATAEAAAELSRLCREVIMNPTGKVRHIGEWCKKLDCWKQVQELKWTVPGPLARELVELRTGREPRPGDASALDIGLATPTGEEAETVSSAAEVSAEEWFRLSNWAKETNNLAAWQRSLAYSLGQRAARKTEPTVKQAAHGLKILAEAKRLGFG